MQFLTLWTSLNCGLLQFNYSISTQYRLTACTWARKSTADYWLTASRRLLCAFLARGLKMASMEIQFKMWAIPTEKEKIINEHQHYWTKRWISWGHHACLLVIQLRLQLLVASVLIESNSFFAETCFFYFLLSWRHYNWSDSPSGRWTCESMFPLV